jgi:hypothetical protein
VIEFYPSKLEGSPLERHKTDRVMTLEQWLLANVSSYQPRKSPPISIEVNGVFIAPESWTKFEFGPHDIVKIFPEPKGIETAIIVLIVAVVAVGVILLTQKPLATPSSDSKSGKNLNLAKTTGNQVKLGDVIREAAGRNEIFPDYLTPTRRWFGDDPKVQWVEMLICVGVGEFEIDSSEIYIGGTAIASLGSSVDYRIYGPGESVATEDAHLWWHSSEEVGATNSGASGLTLTTTSQIDQTLVAETVQLNGLVVSVPAGAGWFPVGWAAGLIVRIEAPYQYQFGDSGAGTASVVSGENLSMLGAFVGMKIEIAGDNAGEYVIATYTPGTPAVSPNVGSASSLTASAVPARLDFGVTPAVMNIGGGPVYNRVPDTYSWLTTTVLPTIVKPAAVTLTGVAIAVSASGFGVQASFVAASANHFIELCTTNNAAGWNISLPAGTYTVSVYASSATDGATIQCGYFDGADRLGTVQAITATRMRYTFTFTLATASTGAVICYINRSNLTSNTVTIDSAMLENGATASAFARGTRVVTLNTTYADVSSLAAGIASKISGSGISASVASGRIRLVEAASPYSGRALAISGTTADVFGSAPVSATGVASASGSAAVPPKMTLKYDSGLTVTGLQVGDAWSTIGYRDLRYRITAVADDAAEDDEATTVDEGHGPSSITVARLTDTGTQDGSWAGFSFMNSNSVKIPLDGSTTEGDWVGPFAACPKGEDVRSVEVDFFFPQGLVRYTEKNGNIRKHFAQVEVQYRDIETAGAWTSLPYTFEAMSQDQQGYTRRFSVSSRMRPEIRVRRIGEESTSTNKFNRVQWYGLRSRIDKAPESYQGCTTMALYVRGGDRLAAQAQSQVSVVATRKLPVLVDGEWTTELFPTREIAPWVNYVSKSVGANDGDLDVEEFARYSPIWADRQDYFDYKVEDDSTVKECINDALLAGFAEFTLERGRITPVRDEPRTQIGKMYTHQNMTTPLKRGFTLPAPDDFDGVVVKYIDEVTNSEEVVDCSLPGDAKLTVQTITLRGVRNRDRAWRIGRRKRRAQVYQTKSYSWGTELDAMNSGYLSYDAVADDIPGYGQSAILDDFTVGEGPVILESSEPFVWEDEASHVIALRRPDGTVSGPWPASRISEFRVAVPAIDFDPDLSWEIEPPHLLFGTSTRWCYPVLVTLIDPGDNSADMEAVNYDVRVYADDDNFAPA